MANFGLFRGFSEKLFQGELPINLGKIGSEDITPIAYLLDLYPSASAAYSLRKLLSSYTGAAIRVRRSSDNTEQDIGFTATGNLDTTALTTFCGAGNGFVTTWYDQSGNARNATQTTAANQPQIVSSGSIINENSKPTLQFDGSNDGFTISNRPLTNATAFSIFSIFNFKTTNQYEMLFVQSDGLANNNRLEIRRNNFADSLQYIGNDTSTTTMNGTITINNKQVLNSYIGYSNIATAHINNVQDVTSTNQTILIGDYVSEIGQRSALFCLGGILQELIIYASNQSSNRTGIQSNINTYYAIY